ncbi:hypothetical protein GGQ88_003253 [Novosphingobium hassiacum]|uniref:Uncharacterized protein n=1 Tax=Novosphingobium hassiacum TaxID=173676 RepID=A0A7W6EX34_9SPHN|nr:hypothetical protein [Novosphingobium hassiacum]MBB3861963.1 hypothetical protein [Novosphingobium hassiacum]
MVSTKALFALTSGALLLAATPGVAQAQTSSTQENTVGSILRSVFGDRLGVSTSVEQQWATGRKPLATQRAEFNTKIDAEVGSGKLTATNGTRMKTEYDRLVALETRYGADGRFTTQERTELADGYGALTQALTDGGYADTTTSTKLAVAEGRADFERRVDAGVTARRLTRTQATRLKADYAALITAEASYARDGISSSEQDMLDQRLDALDARVGDTAYGSTTATLDSRTRLANIDRAVSTSGLGTAQQTRLRVELGDLMRLEAAYARSTPTSDDKAYLERRIVDLETRARVKR